MEQFNLEKWLKDKSRKVVTRDGRLVRIICTDVISHFPIVAAIKLEVGNEFIQEYDLRGRASLSKNEDCDLFFADEEEKLTDFEKAVEKTIPYKIPIDMLKSTSQQLLELAKKEIEKENSEFKPKFTYNEKNYSKLANKLIEFRNNTPLCSVSYRDSEGRGVILHYEKEILKLVKNEILKDLPKWKKFLEEYEELDSKAILLEDNERVVLTEYLEKGDYYIDLEDLKTLPKEE